MGEYHDALYVGIRPFDFGELTHGEIQAAIKAYNRREKERADEEKSRLKGYAGFLYRTAALISVMVWEPKKAPTLEKTFPELFGDETQAEVPLWKRQQAGMAAYAAAYNARLKARQRG